MVRFFLESIRSAFEVMDGAGGPQFIETFRWTGRIQGPYLLRVHPRCMLRGRLFQHFIKYLVKTLSLEKTLQEFMHRCLNTFVLAMCHQLVFKYLQLISGHRPPRVLERFRPNKRKVFGPFASHHFAKSSVTVN